MCALTLHHDCALICTLWQRKYFLTARLYNIWLPVSVCMTSVHELTYRLLFLQACVTVCMNAALVHRIACDEEVRWLSCSFISCVCVCMCVNKTHFYLD